MTTATATASAPAARPKPRERVLAAAARLFIREGVNAVGVDRIAQEAQVSKRSIYQHFEGKDAIVAEMQEALTQMQSERRLPVLG